MCRPAPAAVVELTELPAEHRSGGAVVEREVVPSRQVGTEAFSWFTGSQPELRGFLRLNCPSSGGGRAATAARRRPEGSVRQRSASVVFEVQFALWSTKRVSAGIGDEQPSFDRRGRCPAIGLASQARHVAVFDWRSAGGSA